MTQSATLKLAYHAGKLEAAYLYLPRRPGDRSCRVVRRAAGVVIDYSQDGRPIGIEFSAPSHFSLPLLDESLAAAFAQSDTAPAALLLHPLQIAWIPPGRPASGDGRAEVTAGAAAPLERVG